MILKVFSDVVEFVWVNVEGFLGNMKSKGPGTPWVADMIVLKDQKATKSRRIIPKRPKDNSPGSLGSCRWLEL